LQLPVVNTVEWEVSHCTPVVHFNFKFLVMRL
jgi:hypothetical protein